jgi:hypothetical protein
VSLADFLVLTIGHAQQSTLQMNELLLKKLCCQAMLRPGLTMPQHEKLKHSFLIKLLMHLHTQLKPVVL